MSCGCRITQHSKDWNGFSFPTSSKFQFVSIIKPHHHHHHHQQHPPLIRKFLPLPSFRTTTTTSKTTRLLTNSSSYVASAFPFISCLQSRLPRQLHVLADSSFSQKEDDRELSSEGLSSITGSIVALGKFDALHIGHRELAIQASNAGVPILLSFVGMAEVLGWTPRPLIVAKCDRERVLSSWAPYCGNVAPKEFLIDFAGVRHLTPPQFVEKLSKLGVAGVVAGENYRFGYKAAGDATELVRLCNEYGLHAYIINSVMDKNQNLDHSSTLDKKDKGQVSSTRVRYALDKGDMQYVSELLGRQHRLILSAENKEEFVSTQNQVSAPKSCLLNLPPKEGSYENCSLIIGEDDQLPCRVLIDSTHIHLESDDKNFPIHNIYQDHKLLGIEFRGES